MEQQRIQRRRGRRRSVSFNPSHQYIAQSVEDYLKSGGKITKVERINGSYENFVSIGETQSSVDDFLMES